MNHIKIGLAEHEFTPSEISKEFFDCNDSVKASVKMTAEYPYGYEKAEILSQGFTGEGIQPDLKETYNIKVNSFLLSGLSRQRR